MAVNKSQVMNQTKIDDVTSQLTQKDRWTIQIGERDLLLMPIDKRFDYELKLTPTGVRVIQRDLDEGKVG